MDQLTLCHDAALFVGTYERRSNFTLTVPTLNLFHPLRYWNDEPTLIPEGDPALAKADIEDSLSKRYAFSMGEEIGKFRQYAPEEREGEDVRRGYDHGLAMPAKHANVEKRKLLQVRRNAYSRSIAVSSLMTEEYLRSITVTVCPVSGVELTQGTLTEADWSIDRLDNGLGYVPGNVCVVSRRVNELKSADRFLDIANEARAILSVEGLAGLSNNLGNGLMVVEALRIAALMAAPSAFAQGKATSYAPFAMALGVVSTVQAGLAGIHVGCARTRLEGRAYRRRVNMIKHLGDQTWRVSNRLVEMLRSRLASGIHPCDVWLDGDAMERLMSLNAAIYASPPELPNVSDDEALALVQSSVGSLTPFNRTR